jgi:hypothetical protein
MQGQYQLRWMPWALRWEDQITQQGMLLQDHMHPRHCWLYLLQ